MMPLVKHTIKLGRMLGLPYPGGPLIDKLAHLGQDTYNLPRPMLDPNGYDFSFSGLKSAVITSFIMQTVKVKPLISTTCVPHFKQAY